MRNENEQYVSADEERVAKLLGGLNRVEVPANFYTRLRAKIANARTGERRSPIFAMVRVGAPAAVLVALGAFLFYSTLITPDTGDVVVATEQTTPLAAETRDEPIRVPGTDQTAAVDAEGSQEIAAPTEQPRLVTDRPVTREIARPERAAANTTANGGGSLDSALRSAQIENPELPEGINPSATPVRVDAGQQQSGEVEIAELFELIGIDARFDGGWKVRSVDSARLAARSGVREGDVITQINGTAVGAESKFAGGSSFSSITVRRGGETLTLQLKN